MAKRPVPRRAGDRNLSRLVAGAVKSALDAHPDWVKLPTRDQLLNSITKRVVGRLRSSYAAQQAQLRGIAPGVSAPDDQ